ncbi:MAG: response regulator transcription factor [Mariprofundus sp.]|nr:response regulator transcription factor [Mariprofundus sp.]
MKILIVDDHRVLCECIKLFLQDKYGDTLTLLQAGTGQSALNLAEQHPELDLILLDIGLPDMHGFEVIQQLQENNSGISIIAFSGTVTQQFIRQCLALNIAGFIPKTSSATEMTAAIDLVLGGGIYIPHEALSDTEHDTNVAVLTNRQLDILRLIRKGMSNDEIASILDICTPTVKTHVHSILATLDVKNRTEAVNESLLQNLL